MEVHFLKEEERLLMTPSPLSHNWFLFPSYLPVIGHMEKFAYNLSCCLFVFI